MGSKMLVAVALMAALVVAPAFAGVTGEEDVPERSVVFQNNTSDQTVPEIALGDDVIGYLAGPLSFSGRDHELNTQLSFQMQTEDDGDVSSAAVSASASGQKINPGRAILMSALIPGAGQFYAGSNMNDDPTMAYIKSAVFFAAEIGFWTGAILYAKKGQDKEDEYEQYADGNWDESVYLDYEYWLATTQSGGTADSLYAGTQDQWENESWDERLRYLPANFTHELPDSKDQQYYEMIGKYLTQFGIGWDDVVPSGQTPQEYFPTWYSQDAHNFNSIMADAYANMRYDSNKLLDRSSTFFMAIMVNHVVSAVDAAFTVRLYNNRLVRGEVTSDMRFFNGEPVVMGGVNLKF